MYIDKQEFLANLRLTQAYCERQILQADSQQPVALLRNLNPVFREEKLFCYQENSFAASNGKMLHQLAEWHQDADPYDGEFFALIFENQIVAKFNVLKPDDNSEYEGAVLVIEYDLDIPDGRAAVESKGFVDGFDFPPIDTWFYRAQNGSRSWVLFAWVPRQFMELAQEAIDVHFLNIIHWFEDWAPAEYARIAS